MLCRICNIHWKNAIMYSIAIFVMTLFSSCNKNDLSLYRRITSDDNVLICRQLNKQPVITDLNNGKPFNGELQQKMYGDILISIPTSGKKWTFASGIGDSVYIKRENMVFGMQDPHRINDTGGVVRDSAIMNMVKMYDIIFDYSTFGKVLSASCKDEQSLNSMEKAKYSKYLVFLYTKHVSFSGTDIVYQFRTPHIKGYFGWPIFEYDNYPIVSGWMFSEDWRCQFHYGMRKPADQITNEEKGELLAFVESVLLNVQVAKP